ncbi:MAG: ABC transporter permease [Acidobacteriota bacterium]|nr:ABC transporter permease [Acidobacteriota bacterium]
MIRTLLAINWLNLKRDRVALGLTFVLPLVFFSIFAVIFGGMGSGSIAAGSMKVIGVDLDHTDVSRKFIDALDGQDAIDIVTAPEPTENEPEPEPFSRDSALLAVRTGDRSVAVVVPEGFAASFGNFGGDTAKVELIHDPANPLVQHIVSGLIQASAMTAAPDILLDGGLEHLETFGGALTPQQEQVVDTFKEMLKTGESSSAAGEPGAAATAESGSAFAGLVEIEAVSAMEAEEDSAGGGPSIVSYYAAGIGVMFLLFSMAAAGAALLEEEESGTLERLLSSRVGMQTLLAGNWLFYSAVGFAQLAVMFTWGALVFDLDLFTPKHLAGFAAMSLVTAVAAAAFGIMLAAICKSRAQLNGISTVVILVMSALGGSMVPRFAMPEFMNTTALFTFNGWALDGYLKVFWYGDPAATLLASLLSLVPQLAVLAGMTIVFLVIARVLARRWEAV